MPALSFSLMKEKILDGSKRQTVRKLRKRPIKVGDKLFLFWKQRTKECERLKEASCLQEFKIQLVLSDSGSKLTVWMLVGYLGVEMKILGAWKLSSS